MGIRKRKTKKGFTVIEAIISLVLFTMIMIPLGSFTIMAIKNTSNSAEKQKAMDIAQSIIEQIKAIDSSDIDNLNNKLHFDEISNIKINKVFKNEIFNGYDIRGDNSEFHIEGKITPNEYYVNKDENNNNNFDYYVYIDDESIRIKENSKGTFSNNIELSKDRTLCIFEKSDGSIYVNKDNNKPFNSKGGNCNIKVIYTGKGKANGINLDLKNLNSDGYLSVYCYKKIGSNFNFNILNTEGSIRIYNNLYEGKTNISKSSLFDINLKILKDNKLVYEINSTKVIKE